MTFPLLGPSSRLIIGQSYQPIGSSRVWRGPISTPPTPAVSKTTSTELDSTRLLVAPKTRIRSQLGASPILHELSA